MKTLVVVLACLVGLSVGVIALGLALPATVTVTRSAVFPVRADRLFALVSTVSEQSAWRRDVGRVTMADDRSRWTEHTRSGDDIAFRLVRSVPDERFEIAYESPRGFSGSWVGVFEARGGETALTVSETVTVPSPLGRLIGRIVAPPGAHADLYLADLARAVAR